MAKIGLLSLKQTLANNVCEIRFAKRRAAAFRNMLCTLDQSILNSVNGRTTLNYKPPSGPPKYNPESKNLLLAWDNLIKTIPKDDFWEYFNNTLFGMTVEEKNQFMGK